MTKKFKKNSKIINSYRNLNNVCEECKKEDESVSQNLILTGFKLCKSCRTSKTVFPIQVILLTGKASIRLNTKEIDKNDKIKKAKKTTPKDFKFDFKFKICFVAMISEANIQN